MTKNSTVRQRFKQPRSEKAAKGSFLDSKRVHSQFHNDLVPTSYFFSIIGLMIVVLISAVIIEKQLPPGLKIEEEHKYPDRFIAERAYNILKSITDLGPRVAGSYVNEVLTVNLLKKEIDSIISNAKSNNIIQLDIQKTDGAFYLTFLDGMTNVYRNMQNVIVKIGSRINSPHSLLINCHFDTVANSPGGSDDGAGCAVMLEMLRILSQSNKILRHNIIFLFNGGEENFMPASHGFITQHKWAKEIRAFINLEACGAGGREILFQAGPNHPWLLETYSEEVPYPYASSMAQEIFQSGIIPGDTDYRIFRDFGNLSGLDFAWSANGYVYHTKFDSLEQVSLGVLQRTGDNILALARGMAQGHQLANIESHRAGNLVFFDFLGAFVVRWPMIIADVINLLTVILSLYSIRKNMSSAYVTDAITPKEYIQKLIKCIGAILTAATVSVIVAIIIALLLNALGRTMSWYARPLWVLFLYIVPTMLVAMLGILYHARTAHKDVSSSIWTVFQFYYDSYQILWTIVLFFGILLRICSSFVALFWSLFPALSTLLLTTYLNNWKFGGKRLVLHVAVLGLPFVQCLYLLLGALYLCIPIMGRSGAGFNSEILIALVVSFLYGLLISYVVPLIIVVRNVERVFSLMLGVFLLSLAVLILTPLGFPYSGDPQSPAPQRFMMAHAKRTYHDVSGKIIDQTSGYWIADMDINSPHSVDRYVPEMEKAVVVDEDCVKYLYCGLPYLVPVQNFIFKTHWVDGPMPIVKDSGVLKVINRKNITGGERVTMQVTGPFHMGIMLSPALGVELVRWSIVEGVPLAAAPLWNKRKTYFVYYGYAGEVEPLTFSLDLKIPRDHSGTILDYALSCHFQFEETSDIFQNLLNRFPPWTVLTYWTATYESWVI